MDPILYWNDVALEANRISHTNGKNEQTGPPLSSRALAIVHLAIYDAYIGVSPSGADPLSTVGTWPGFRSIGGCRRCGCRARDARGSLSEPEGIFRSEAPGCRTLRKRACRRA